jgi:hypothetical protein
MEEIRVVIVVVMPLLLPVLLLLRVGGGYRYIVPTVLWRRRGSQPP